MNQSGLIKPYASCFRCPAFIAKTVRELELRFSLHKDSFSKIYREAMSVHD